MSDTGKLPRFQQIQYEFTRHLRDPEHNPPPAGLDDQRMGMYRSLVYDNIEGFLASNFPVIRKLTSDSDWHAMVRDYLTRHRSHTPLFPRLPTEFLAYLEQERDLGRDPPFLQELAHYEWIESSVTVDPRETDIDQPMQSVDWSETVPALNPVHHLLAYSFPVHRISKDYQPDEAPATPTYLVVFRDREDKAAFIELNPVTARLLEIISTGTGDDACTILLQIAAELNHPDAQTVVAGGLEILQRMHQRGLLKPAN